MDMQYRPLNRKHNQGQFHCTVTGLRYISHLDAFITHVFDYVQFSLI